jgi:hypothetical protein
VKHVKPQYVVFIVALLWGASVPLVGRRLGMSGLMVLSLGLGLVAGVVLVPRQRRLDPSRATDLREPAIPAPPFWLAVALSIATLVALAIAAVMVAE